MQRVLAFFLHTLCWLQLCHISSVLAGRNILPLLTSDAATPHEALLSVQGQPQTIRMGPWKLHVRGTPALGFESLGDDWVDPRRPNGTTILAQAEQAKPSAYPGLKSGDRGSEPGCSIWNSIHPNRKTLPPNTQTSSRNCKPSLPS